MLLNVITTDITENEKHVCERSRLRRQEKIDVFPIRYNIKFARNLLRKCIWNRRFPLLACSLIGLFSLVCAGCGKPGDSANNFTNSVVRLLSLNENQPFQSDVLTDGSGTDDAITAKIQCDFRTTDEDPTAPDGSSVFDTITFSSYHVGHQRSDGGPNPSDFTAGLSLSVAPGNEAEVSVVLVRAFDKHRSPLEELRDDGEIFTTSTITFYGQDGYGNDVAISGSIAVSFANFTDE